MFWGEEVQFNKTFAVKKEDYAMLHLRGASTLWAKEPVTLVVTVQEINQEEDTPATDIVLCHLDEVKHSQHTFNLFFDLAVQKVSFSVTGKGKVQLIGSLEAKEGKALTKELVANLGPQIKENKRKMLMELLALGAGKDGENQQEGEDGDDDISEDDESFKGEEDDEEVEDEEIDEEEEDEDEDEDADEDEDVDEDEEEESMDIEPIQKKQGKVVNKQPKSILKGAMKQPEQKSKKEQTNDEFRAI